MLRKASALCAFIVVAVAFAGFAGKANPPGWNTGSSQSHGGGAHGFGFADGR